MIYKLEDTKRAEKLYGDWAESGVWSCVQGVMGVIYADDLEAPKTAMAVLGEYCYLAGEPSVEFLHYYPVECKVNPITYIPQNDVWAELIEQEFGNNAKMKIRYEMKKEKDIFDKEKLQEIVASLPKEYEMKLIDRSLYDECLKEEWCEEFVANYDTYEFYEKAGLGAAILKDGKLIAGASSFSSFKDGIEVIIATKEEHRRNGFAYICAAKLILECLERDWCPSWDAAVMRSCRLAEKLGYHLAYEYVGYEVERGEN